MADFLLESKLGFALLMAFLVSLTVLLWIVSSYYEAEAFNRITGKNVSTLDAMFVQLRVQAEASN